MIKFAASLLFFVTFSVSAWAQNEGSISANGGYLSTTANTSSNTAIILNVGAILNKGFGIGFMRHLSENVAGLVHYSKQTLDSDEDSDSSLSGYSAEHRVEESGVRFDYYFSTVYQSGFYVGAGLTQINLKTKVDPIFSDDKRTLEADKLGGQGFAGYNIRTGAIAAKIGLGYGNGGSFSNNLGGTRNEIKNDLLLDTSISIIF